MRRFGFCAVFFAASLAAQAATEFSASDINAVVPSFDVRFSAGFNYDLLRPPTAVSFRYPAGYIGLNLPVNIGGDLQSVPAVDGLLDDFFNDDTLFRRGSDFRPNAGASQNPNFTVRVDVPMLYGVGSFAYTQNFFMNFNTAVGDMSVISSYKPITYEPDDTDLGSAAIDVSGSFLALRGGLRIPLAFNFGWETMTFGYAYRVAENDNLVFALNLHRHLFSMDIRARADIDLLGHLNLNARVTSGDRPIPIELNEAEDIIDFSSDTCNGAALGRYRAEVWTPSIGVKLWRFALTSRFGIDTKAKGSINGRFTVPKIVDIETGELSDEYNNLIDDLSGNPKKILDTISRRGSMKSLITSEVDSIVYETTEPLTWKMPSGHTVAFDIIPNKLSLSYTKLFGEVAMKLDNFNRKTVENKVGAESGSNSGWVDTLSFDVGVTVDHIIMLHVNYPSFFINAGVCAFDVRNGSDEYIIGNLYKDNKLDFLRFGDAAMLPVLNGGLTLGTKIQLRIEADLLPLPAVRTGFHYYF